MHGFFMYLFFILSMMNMIFLMSCMEMYKYNFYLFYLCLSLKSMSVVSCSYFICVCIREGYGLYVLFSDVF